MKKIIIIFGVFLYAAVASSTAFANITQFVGRWQNVDAQTRGLTGLEISLDGAKSKIRIFGSCSPRDCDWGETEAVAYAPSIESNLAEKAETMTAIYKTSFSVEIVVVRPSKGGGLQAEVFTQFTDKSRRANAHRIDNLVRSSANPVIAVPVGNSPTSDTEVAPAAITVAKQTEMESLARNYNLGNRRADSAGGAKTSQSGYDGKRGWWLCYETGCVYYTPATGVHAVYGTIFKKWIQVGHENGLFGYPTTEELSCSGSSDRRDRYQRFQGGVIYWRAAADTAIAYTKGASGEDHREFPCR